jgi:hypothetical protein
MFWYGLLETFSKEHGHCRVPAKYKTDDGYRLGTWVVVQRVAHDKMEPGRRQRLEALPDWSRDVFSDAWEEGFSRLKQYSDREKHCRVASSYITDDGYRLGAWVGNQRTTRDKIEPDRRRRLEELPGWSWNALSDRWEEGFARLKQFSEREGHCRVPAKYKTDDGYRLGKWINQQRTHKDELNPDRRRRLDAISDWSWDVLSDVWEEAFSRLKQFSEREGHCRVSQSYKTNDGYRLGVWVGSQRTTRDKMETDRRRRLEELPGWSWDVLSDVWEEGFTRLKEYSDREGHCRVPVKYKTDDGYRLGRWINHKRTYKDSMEPDRRRRLEALPGWSWDARSDNWEEGYFHLKVFSDRERHCRVPRSYKTDDGYRLGGWVGKQRSKNDKMDPDRRQRLEALPGWVWKDEK